MPIKILLINDDEDIIKGYEKGADDYLLKPFSFDILLLKIQTILRRHTILSHLK